MKSIIPTSPLTRSEHVAKAITAERDPHLTQLRSMRNKLQRSVEAAKASATLDLFARCF